MEDGSKPQFNAYLDRIRERAKESHIHSRHQMIGLMVADALEDSAHKALYIKMARDENGEKMLYMAKSIAENSKVENKGAYFMKVWRMENKATPKKTIVKKKKSTKSSSPKKKNGSRNGKKPE